MVGAPGIMRNEEGFNYFILLLQLKVGKWVHGVQYNTLYFLYNQMFNIIFFFK